MSLYLIYPMLVSQSIILILDIVRKTYTSYLLAGLFCGDYQEVRRF
jgi:hypothetical protein